MARAKTGERTSPATTPHASETATIGFGLVKIDVKMAPALDEDHAPVRGRRICPDHMQPLKQMWRCEIGEHVMTQAESEIAYEWEDKLVKIPSEVIAGLALKRDGHLQIDGICPAEQIDPYRFDKTYFIWPDTGSARQFKILVHALRTNDEVAIGRIIFRKKMKMLILKWSDEFGLLIAHTCAFDEQIRTHNADMLVRALASMPEPTPEEIAMGEMLINELRGDFAGGIDNEYARRFRATVKKAAGGGAVKAPAQRAAAAPDDGTDLLAALRASVAAHKQKSAKKPAQKRPARPTAAAKKAAPTRRRRTT